MSSDARGSSKVVMDNSSEAYEHFDYMLKVLVIGNSAVGKTSMLVRYTEKTFQEAFVSTVGIDFKVKTLHRNGKKIKLQVWDTAGQERYRTITTAYYRGAMGFLLVFDITCEESFKAVTDWATQIRDLSSDNTSVILVGNKIDLKESRCVTSGRARQLAQSLGYQYFETSAKDGVNIAETFEAVVDLICEKMHNTLDQNPPDPFHPLPHQQAEPYRKQCSC